MINITHLEVSQSVNITSVGSCPSKRVADVVGRESNTGYARFHEIGDFFADVMIPDGVVYIKQYGRVYRCEQEGDEYVICERVN